MLVYVGDGADELGKDLLDFVNRQRAMLEEIVVEFIACNSLVSIFASS